MLTSNRTRELHDALKRRCLYEWIDYPSIQREVEIVHARLPGVPDAVAARVAAAVARLREQELYKLPGVGETITWARALLAVDDLEGTLGAALKVREDVERVRAARGAGGCLRRQTADGRRQGEGLAEQVSRWPSLAARGACAWARARCSPRIGPWTRWIRRSRAAGRSWPFGRCCARGASDREAFAAAFEEVFGAGELREWTPAPPALDDVARMVLPRTAVPDQVQTVPPSDVEVVPAAWSEEEMLRDKDFARVHATPSACWRAGCSRGSRSAAPPARAVACAPPARRGRRPDLRRTLRASLRHGGEPLERRWRAPARRPRPLVLVADVSGSMEPYARMLLQYLHAAVAARTRVEAFVFGTRLTRVTRELAGRDHDRALRRARRARSRTGRAARASGTRWRR